MRRAQHTTQWGRGAVAALATGLLALAGCGDEPAYFAPSHVESSAPYVRPTPEEAAAGADVVRALAAQLWGPIADEAPDENRVWSPLSIAVTLGMARAGAEGASAEQLDALYGVPATVDGAGLHRAVGGANETLRQLAGPVQLADETLGEIELSTANAVWGQSGVDWEEAFLDELATAYDASVWNADYTGDPEQARIDINRWVAERTAERIDALLPEGAVTTDTRMVLTNALRFSAPWRTPLEEVDDAPFTTATGDEVSVPMLTTTEPLVHRTGDGWQSVSLPYAGSGLAMTLLLPDAGELGAVEGALDADLLREATTGGDERAVALTFPAFAFGAGSGVADALRAVGVDAPFGTEDDFLPMTADPIAQPLAVDDVVHEATIAVDAQGTEASAASAVTMSTVSALLPDVELTVDRPFLFVIHDVDLGIPLLVGRVADPLTSD